MALYITSLNSGSNGNCYYIGNEQEAVLIDAGISCKETERRMRLLGLSMEKVKAIFISHEHSDHIAGLVSLTKKYQLPVYITRPTLQKARLPIEYSLTHSFSVEEPVAIGSLSITAFAKKHDAIDPHSFIIRQEALTIGVFTDIGQPCEQVVKHFRTCTAAFLEANYEEAMLEGGGYPYFLKNRIRGGHGHLSNAQALELFTKHRPERLSHLLLAHLSKNNNCPKLVQALFDAHSQGTNVVVASRQEATPVYCIEK